MVLNSYFFCQVLIVTQLAGLASFVVSIRVPSFDDFPSTRPSSLGTFRVERFRKGDLCDPELSTVATIELLKLGMVCKNITWFILRLVSNTAMYDSAKCVYAYMHRSVYRQFHT